MVNFLNNLKIPILPMLVRRFNVFFTGADIFPSAKIGNNVRFIHSVGIVIGEHVVIEDNCRIFGGVVLGGSGGTTKEDGQPTKLWLQRSRAALNGLLDRPYGLSKMAGMA